MQQQRKVLSIIGTRPEAVKMAPVMAELTKRTETFASILVSTAQHREMLDQIFTVFDLVPDVDLDIMRPNQSLSDITHRALKGIEALMQQIRPDLILVQGDTTTVFAAALAAFYHRLPIGHVEAGLRSHDFANPYPEEMNRRFTDMVTTLHFAPTQKAKQNLLQEGVAPEHIFVTGNPVVDALQRALTRLGDGLPANIPSEIFRDTKVILVTAHRRENHGAPLERICRAIQKLVQQHTDVHCIYPVHLNPQVQGTVQRCLAGVDRVHLIPPLDYWSFVQLMARSFLVLTDSGGIQEEAPSLRKPVLVLRKVTERPEAADAGLAKVIGTEIQTIVDETSRLLYDPAYYTQMCEGKNPYGDGRAAERIVDAIVRYFARETQR